MENEITGGLEIQEEPKKVVEFEEVQPKRKPFTYWSVSGRDYRLKLTAANIERLENKYHKNIMTLVSDLPPLSTMLTIVQAAMLPWEHGISYNDIQRLFDKYVEEGGSQIAFYKDVFVPIMAVSGFFTEKMAEEIMSQTAEEI